MADRALTRVRFPDGVDSASFYEKNAPLGTPPWVRTVRVDTSDGLITYAVCDDAETLVWLANLAALELHVPQWTFGSATPGPDGVITPVAQSSHGPVSRWPIGWWSISIRVRA